MMEMGLKTPYRAAKELRASMSSVYSNWNDLKLVEDFRIDYKEKLDELNKKENNKVIRYLNGKISMLIRENFDNIVDGEF